MLFLVARGEDRRKETGPDAVPREHDDEVNEPGEYLEPHEGYG
jgi:hypothetical protein